MRSRSNIRADVLSKIKFNGVGGWRTYLGFANSRRTCGKGAMNIDVELRFDLSGVRIPDSKLAREITELVRDTESSLLFPFQPRVLLGRSGRQASRIQIRSRTALCRRDVPRHGLDPSAQQPNRALRGRRRECRP